MEIKVSVIDGMLGRPAEGVGVSLVIRQVTEPAIRVSGLTDSSGNFGYSAGAQSRNCNVLIDVDTYFTSLGMVAGYQQMALEVRLAAAGSPCRIVAIIAPYVHVAASVQ